MRPLTNADRELAHALDATGLPYRAGLVLIALGRTETATFSKLEAVSGLRKEEVKAAVKELEERKWVFTLDRKRADGTGFTVLKAREPFATTLGRIIDFQEQQIARIGRNLEILRQAVDR